MSHETLQPSSNLSRRAAIGGVEAAAAALGLSTVSRVAAQDATPGAMAAHPMMGAWLVMNPGDPPHASPVIISADGTSTVGDVPATIDPQLGLVFQGTPLGVWEPVGERGVHLTYVQGLATADGTYNGTFTLDAYPVASEDGESWSDDGTKVHITIRDAYNAITLEAGGEGADPITPPVHAQRMHVGNPGFPEAGAATPTA